MASGGARATSGPPADPSAARRERKDDAGWIQLPAVGRTDPAPTWPLTGLTPRESELWEREWQRPQAIMWERNGQDIEVALYVRRLIIAEDPDAPVTLLTWIRQMQESLGLSVPGLARNRWIIVDGTAGPQHAKPTDAKVVDAKSRFGKR